MDHWLGFMKLLFTKLVTDFKVPSIGYGIEWKDNCRSSSYDRHTMNHNKTVSGNELLMDLT